MGPRVQAFNKQMIVWLTAASMAAHVATRAEGPAASAANGPQSTTQPGEMLEKEIGPILADLASGDFGIRAGAQKRLDGIEPRAVEVLRRAAGSVKDDEVKARLVRRIREMDDWLALNPSPLSLHVKDATFDQVCRALRESGLDIDLASSHAQRNLIYTLDISDQSFAQVLQKIEGGTPLSIYSMREGSISFQPPTKDANVYWGPNVRVAQSWIGPMGGGPMGGGATDYLVGLSVLIDPRVKISGCKVVVDRAEDELGNALAIKFNEADSPPSVIFGGAFTVAMPLAGKEIANLKGVLNVTLCEEAATLEVKDPEKHLNEVFKLGKGASISIRNFVGRPDDVQCTGGPGATDKEIDDALHAGKIASRSEGIVMGKVIDATGKTVVTFSPRSGSGVSGGNVARLPLKVQFIVPVKTRQVEIPFELNHIVVKRAP